MMPPPPMPNRPAKSPVTTPPPRINSTSQTISPIGLPSTRRPGRRNALGGDVRQIVCPVHYQRQRSSHDRGRCALLDRLGREVPAEGARAGNAAEKAEDVAGDGMEPHPFVQLALDIGDKPVRSLFGAREGGLFTEHHGVDVQQPPRLLIG